MDRRRNDRRTLYRRPHIDTPPLAGDYAVYSGPALAFPLKDNGNNDVERYV